MAEAATTSTVMVDVSVDGQRLRVEALDFAIRAGDGADSPEDTVARANTYYEFLRGEASS